MHRHWVFTVGTVAGLLMCGSPGRAQNFPPGFGRPLSPAYSPYNNLLRPAPMYQNYYGLVRPELEFRGNIQSLQQQAFANRQGIVDLESGTVGIAPTGHPTRFLNTGGYFLSSGRGARPGGGRPMTAGSPLATPATGVRTTAPAAPTAPR